MGFTNLITALDKSIWQWRLSYLITINTNGQDNNDFLYLTKMQNAVFMVTERSAIHDAQPKTFLHLFVILKNQAFLRDRAWDWVLVQVLWGWMSLRWISEPENDGYVLLWSGSDVLSKRQWEDVTTFICIDRSCY